MSRNIFSNPITGGIQAGRLSDLIIFQQKVITYVGEQATTSWSIFLLWGEAIRLSEQAARFTIRFRPDIRPHTHRIIFWDAIWTITNAVPDHRNTITMLESDFTQLIEVTHMKSLYKEYIEGLPIIRPPAPE